ERGLVSGMRLAPLLTLALALRAATAFGGERVMVLGLSSSNSIPTEIAASFEKSIHSGRDGAGFEVGPDAELGEPNNAQPESASSSEPACLVRMGALLHASRVVEGLVVSEGNNYSFSLRLIDLPSGRVLKEEHTCEICTLAEAADTVNQTAATLI